MLPDLNQTIVALASGAVGARRAIVRLSGPNTLAILRQLCSPEPSTEALPMAFSAAQRLTWCDSRVWLPEIGRSLPVTLLFWPDHRSYTGQPSAEIHLLGSLPLVQATIDQCVQLGAAPAQPGEFTLRAFLAGRLDLAQAEAVLGVIHAETEEALSAALVQLGGNLAPAIAPLRQSLLGVLAELEAGLDFVDEDIQFIEPAEILAQLQAVQDQLTRFRQRLVTRSRSDLAPKVVLAGLPNSGKSTLYNALCQQQLAIVADIAGTTRDYLQQRINCGPVEVDLIDTAGWEELGGDTPRAQAQQQLAEVLKQAQLGLLCIDTSATTDGLGLWSAISTLTNQSCTWLLVGTKADRVNQAGRQALRAVQLAWHSVDEAVCHTSITDSRSIDQLRNSIARAIQLQQAEQTDDPLALVHETAVRCRCALDRATEALNIAIERAQAGGGEELVAAELRLVLDELATIVGEIHSDDVLGEIFSRFCIGK